MKAAELMTVKEVADLWKVEPRTVLRWAQNGRLKCLRMGRGTIRFRRQDVFELLEHRWDEPGKAAGSDPAMG